jgi:hypothetical protein
MQRKHCLAAVACEVGFASWAHALRVLEGDATEGDFGKALYGAIGGAYLNSWFATYAEAHTVHAALGEGERRYLLAYQRHVFLADRGFVEALGLDPDDDDWQKIGWDWVRPADGEARRRLYGKLLSRSRLDAA